MMNQIKLLGIAPYEELNNSMQFVSAQFPNVQTDIFTADLAEGEKLARELFVDGYDAIISRAGTASLIRQAVSIPVIDISISVIDILSAIRLAENYTKNFAIVGYASITEKAHLLCSILEYTIEIHTITNNAEAQAILDRLAEQQFEIILCDAITNRLATAKGLNTLLVTSGMESIKHAFKEAIANAQYLKQLKHQKDVLFQGIAQHSQQYLIIDQQQVIHFSNLDKNLEQLICKYLQSTSTPKHEQQLYSPIDKLFYSVSIQPFSLDGMTYYSCTAHSHTVAKSDAKAIIRYLKQPEVADIFSTKLVFTQFISEQNKIELQKANGYYSTYFIYGETGTAKKNIAYQAYLNQQTNNNYLISISGKLMNTRMWRFLMNSSSSPLFDTHNTILFSNIEELPLSDIEHLIYVIDNVNLSRNNNIIFTYDISNSTDERKHRLLTTKLDCAKIYAPSLRERKTELNIITTLLLNKINIECNKEIVGFAHNAIDDILSFNWPGNLNQLQSVLKELVIHTSTPYISEHQVAATLGKERIIQSFSGDNFKNFSSKSVMEQPTLFDYTKEIILNILEQNGGNQTKTAKQLNISRTTLWRYLKGTVYADYDGE